MPTLRITTGRLLAGGLLVAAPLVALGGHAAAQQAPTAPAGPSSTAPASPPAMPPVPIVLSPPSDAEKAAPAPVRPGSGIDGMVPAPDLRNGNAPTLQERYPATAYRLHIDLARFGDLGDKALNAIADFFMSIIVAIGVVATRLFQWIFSFDLMGKSSESIPPVVGVFRDVFYEPWLPTVVIVSGIMLGWHGWVHRRTTVVAEGALWLLFAIGVASVFMAAPDRVVKSANAASIGTSRFVLGSVGKLDPKTVPGDGTTTKGTFAGDAADAELRVMADRFWRTFVYRPWAVANFGSSEAADQWGERTLRASSWDPEHPETLATSQREYQAIQNDLDAGPNAETKHWFEGRESAARLGLVTVALVAVLVAGVFLIVAAGAILLAQLALLLLVMGSPFAFILGTFPATRQVLARWIELCLGCLVKRVVYAAVFAVVMVVSGVIVDLVSPLGWGVAAMLQIGLLVTIFAYRNRFKALFAHVGVPALAGAAAGGVTGSMAGAGAGLAAGRSMARQMQSGKATLGAYFFGRGARRTAQGSGPTGKGSPVSRSSGTTAPLAATSGAVGRRGPVIRPESSLTYEQREAAVWASIQARHPKPRLEYEPGKNSYHHVRQFEERRNAVLKARQDAMNEWRRTNPGPADSGPSGQPGPATRPTDRRFGSRTRP